MAVVKRVLDRGVIYIGESTGSIITGQDIFAVSVFKSGSSGAAASSGELSRAGASELFAIPALEL